MPPDRALLACAFGGDHRAFAIFVERHRQSVFSTARNALGGNGDDAQDVTQEVFLYAFVHLARLRDVENVPAYLRTTTLHLCADFRRRQATRPVPQLPTPFETPAPDSFSDAPERIALRQALARLPAPLRLTVDLFHIGGYGHSEVAVLTHVPVNTVRSRLQRARYALRSDLSESFTAPQGAQHQTMPAATTKRGKATLNVRPLPPVYENLIQTALPGAGVLSVEWEPEPWMPYIARVRVALPKGGEQSVDLRWDIGFNPTPDPDRAFPGVRTLELHGALARVGLPVPVVLAGPVADTSRPDTRGFVSLSQTPQGENLLLWSLEGSVPHRVHQATTIGIAAIDQMHGITDALQADPIGVELPRRPLSLEVQEIADKGGPWLRDPLFADVLERTGNRAAGISVPLVYTNDLNFPNFLRVLEGRVTEWVYPWGHFGDPLLGLAKFWTYDCYPFVHTGFVERYLYEHGVTRRDFAPRLAVRTLWTLQREVPVERPDEGAAYWDALTGLLRHALPDL